MSLIADSIFALLATATVGVYAISPDETIVFWNGAAERILGYPKEEVLGRSCSDLLAEVDSDGASENCQRQCPSIHALQAGLLPSPVRRRMISASGEPKLVSLTPIIVGGTDGKPQLVIQLFTDEEGDDASGGAVGGTEVFSSEPDHSAVPSTPKLTKREMEVLRLVSAGWDTPRIANDLNISPHTVLNHIRHFRRKLGAPTKLDAVVTAIRLGMLPVG